MGGWLAGEMENKAIFQLEVEVEVGAWQQQAQAKVQVKYAYISDKGNCPGL